MLLRNITWIHSLSRIEMIKLCCSIYVLRNSLILILYNIIIFTYSNIIFTYSNIHCLITLICLIILISHIVKFLLIRKFYWKDKQKYFIYIIYSTFSKASMKKTVITVVTQNHAFPIKFKSTFLEKYLI